GRPAEPERRGPDADADGTIGAVRPAVRVGAGNELSRQHEALFGKIKMKDAIARGGVPRLGQAMALREFPPDRRLSGVLGLASKYEMIVGDGRLAREDRGPAGDLVERMDRK